MMETERVRLLADIGVSAFAGLAVDEALMAGYARDEPPRASTLRLYTYRSHCALVGRYQHLEAEVDLEACRRTRTQVSRRPTGGGAIVMGAGQLGIAFVTRAPEARPKELLERYSRGIVAGLAQLGIAASFGGKNDLEVAGRKIAGLGLYADGRGGLLFHASVLADLDVPFMLQVLRIPAAKLGQRGIAAVSERVTTVTRETGAAWSGAALRDTVASGFAQALGLELEEATLTSGERRTVERLERERYRARGWLHEAGVQPDATASSVLRTPEGVVRLHLATQGSTIKSVVFTGDYNELPAPLARFESALRWTRLEPASLRRLAARACMGETGLGVPPDALADAVLRAGRRALARAHAAPVRSQGSCYFPEVG
jgi:lipoate-protein ligase A